MNGKTTERLLEILAACVRSRRARSCSAPPPASAGASDLFGVGCADRDGSPEFGQRPVVVEHDRPRARAPKRLPIRSCDGRVHGLADARAAPFVARVPAQTREAPLAQRRLSRALTRFAIVSRAALPPHRADNSTQRRILDDAVDVQPIHVERAGGPANAASSDSSSAPRQSGWGAADGSTNSCATRSSACAGRDHHQRPPGGTGRRCRFEDGVAYWMYSTGVVPGRPTCR